MNRKLFLTTLTMLALAALPVDAATTYTADKNHSDVSFKIRHLMSPVRGRFTDFSATIVKDDANPANSSVSFTIEAASVETGVTDRDRHLRSDDFFAVEKNPQITFTSSNVEKVSDDIYNVTGKLTMRGVTKVITLPVTFGGEMKDPGGRTRAGFSTEITLNRKEFGINWNKALDNGGYLLADEVKAEISLEVKAES
ncbi:MAG: YceI family protein [Thermoanaerobaculia bacterium]